jgi:hypothetical protein
VTIQVEVEGVGTLEFPDGTDKRVIRSTVQRLVSQQPRGAGGERRTIMPTEAENMGAGEAALLAAGRRGDKMAEGLREAGLGAKVAAKEALGIGETGDDLRAMAAITADQADKDRRFAPVQKRLPMATAVGDTLPAVGFPMGQATAMGRVMAPAVGFGAMEAAQPGTPAERGKRGAVGFGTGFGGGVVSEAAARLVQPVRNVLPGSQQEAARTAAEKIGAQLMPSQQAGSPTLAAFEDMLARSPGGMGPMKQVQDQGRAAVNRKGAEAIGAESLTKEGLAAAAARISADYERLKVGMNMPVTSDVTDAISAAKARLARGDSPDKAAALKSLEKLEDQVYKAKALSGDDYRSWVVDLGDKARSSESREVAQALDSVKRAMNNSARGPNAAEWKELDKENAALETLMKPGVVNEATGDLNPKALARALKSDLGKSYMTGKVKGPLVDVAEYGLAVPQLREGSQTFQRQEMESLIGLAKALMKYPAAKAMASPATGDYLSKGLMANPEASRIAAALIQRGVDPLILGPANLGLTGYLASQ